jgi:hypothetical protein
LIALTAAMELSPLRIATRYASLAAQADSHTVGISNAPRPLFDVLGIYLRGDREPGRNSTVKKPHHRAIILFPT